jgi:hypothetical protein
LFTVFGYAKGIASLKLKQVIRAVVAQLLVLKILETLCSCKTKYGVAILKITDATFAAARNSGKKTTISIGMKIACFWFQDASRFGVGYFLP